MSSKKNSYLKENSRHKLGPFESSAGQRFVVVFIMANLLMGSELNGAVQYQRLKSFGFPNLAASKPSGLLIQGTDGAFYGTSAGAVFKVNENGSGFRVLYRFNPAAGDGTDPAGSLLEASDGALYGTTISGGKSNTGTIFSLNKDGTGYNILHSFIRVEGINPLAGLIEGRDGALYGTSSRGGQDSGTAYKLNKDGSGYTILHNFIAGGALDAMNPQSPLLEGSDGVLYGTTPTGGTSRAGTVFKVNEDGNGYEVLFSFSGLDGSGPVAGLIEGSDGALYGTTLHGGSNWGTVFKLNKDGSGHQVLRDFRASLGDGLYPAAGLLEGIDGALYGTAGGDGGTVTTTVFKLNKDGTGYNILHTFGTIVGDGLSPYFGLVEGSDGALYGTTAAGGIYSAGTIFKLNKSGSGYGVLYSISPTGGDGSTPQARLIEATDGALYGTAGRTVFKLDKDGSGYKLLYRLTGYESLSGDLFGPLLEGSDGALYGTLGNLWLFKMSKGGSGFKVLDRVPGRAPFADLIQGSDGMLYGTSIYGGTNNAGFVFKIGSNGSNYAVLHSFSGTYPTGGDGAYPFAGVIEGSDGTLYGTTFGNTLSRSSNSFGTVFRLNKDGSAYNILHSFSPAAADGLYPYPSLMEGSDGALYGTTVQGGTLNAGTVFKLSKDGSEYSILHQFATNDNRIGLWYWRYSGLAEGRDGALYGTTYFGGSNNVGTVYKINKDGSSYEVLHSFSISGGDGQYPNAALVKGSDGALYGTTVHGGDLGFGTVFRLLVTHPPVAVARAFPLVSFSPTDTNRFVISLNNADASVSFDASQSCDLDNDPLRFFWFAESSLNPFATGVVATNSLSVGSHTIILIANDGMDSGTNRLIVKVITAGQAVEKVLAMVQAAALSDKDAHPLLVTLQAAGDSFDRADTTTGLNQLQVFLRKVRSKVTPNDPTLAEALIQAAQKIIEAFAGI